MPKRFSRLVFILSLALSVVSPVSAEPAARSLRSLEADSTPSKRAAGSGPSQVGVYDEGRWRLDFDGSGDFSFASDRDFGLGFPGAKHFVADWNGDGLDEVGVFANGFWFLDFDGNGTWDGGAQDVLAAFGWAGATPVIGDWNGDGAVELGVYANGFWFLDYDGDRIWDGGTTDLQFPFGWAGAQPIVGDWDGDGADSVGVYSNGFWFLDYDGDTQWDGGTVDRVFGWGWPGVQLVIGDWDGDGRDQAGVYSNGFWFLDYNGDALWDGGVEDRLIPLGWDGAQPVVGDWNGDGRDKAGVFSNGAWFLDRNGTGAWEPEADSVYTFGAAHETPVVGRWARNSVSGSIQMDPPPGSSDQPRNRRIILTLTTPIARDSVDEHTVRVLRDGEPVEVIRRTSYDGRYISVDRAFYGSSEPIEIVVSDLRDASGAPLQSELRAQLGSSGQLDSTSLRVTNLISSPAPTNSEFLFEFNQRLDPATFDPSKLNLLRRADDRQFPMDCELSENWTSVSCVPEEPLGVGTDYSVDAAGLASVLSSGVGRIVQLTTGFAADLSPPQVLGALPQDGSTGHPVRDAVSVYFDDPIRLDSDARITITRAGGAPSAVQPWLLQGPAFGLTVQPYEAGLEPNETYTIRVEGVRNMSGLPMNGSFESTFSTQELSRSTQMVLSPAPGGSDLPVNVNVVVQLPAPVIEGTMTDATFFLRGPSGRVPAQLRAEAGGLRIVLDPVADLEPNADYVAELTEGLKFSASSFASRRVSWPFRTGAQNDDAPPFVESVFPPSGSTGQPLRTRITVRFSEPIEAEQFNQANASFTDQNGVLHERYRIESTGGRTVQIEPWFHDPLLPNTLYRLRLNGINDRAGKPLPPFESTFTTGTFTDTQRPQVISMTPPLGAQGVPLDSVFDLTVNEPLNPLSVSPQTTFFVERVRGEQVPVVATVGGTGTTLRLAPAAPLNANSSYDLMTMAADASGNYLTWSASPLFTTVSGPDDSTRPEVSMLTHDEGEVVPVEREIIFEVVFSEPIDPTTVSTDTLIVLLRGRRQSVFPSRSSDNQRFEYRLSLGPNEATEIGQRIEVIATDQIQDFSGNALLPSSIVFYADARGYDPSHGFFVTELRPEGIEASPNTPVTVVFNEPAVTHDLDQALYVAENGRLIDGVTRSVAGGRAFEFRPTVPFEPGALVQVFVRPNVFSAAEQEAISNPLYGRHFKIAGGSLPSAPQVVSVSPASSCCPPMPANLRWSVRFDSPIDESTVDSQSVQIMGPGGAIPSLVQVLNGDTIDVEPASLLTTGSHFSLALSSAIRGRNGEPIEPYSGGGARIEQPADLIAPEVIAVSPSEGLSDVPANALLSARLSEAINLAKLRTDSFLLTCGGVPFASGSLTVTTDFSGSRVVAEPSTLLPAHAECSVSLAGLEDLAGNRAPAVQWSFRTGADLDTDGQFEVRVSPQSQAGTNSSVVLRFSEPIDLASIDPEQTTLRSNQPVPGSIRFSEDATVMVFTPDSPLGVGLTYRFETARIRDLAGNSYGSASYISHSFRTGFAPDLSPPVVSDAGIVDGAVDVTPFREFAVLMSEAIDPTTVTPENVRLLDGNIPVELFLKLDYDRKTLKFNGVSPLTTGRTYTMWIGGVADPLGNVMAAPFSLSFTVREALDFTRPTATTNVDTNPQGLFRNVAAKVRFSEPLDPTTVTPATIYYVANGAVLPTAPRLDSTETLVELVPAEPLPANASVTIEIASEVTDRFGNAFRQLTFPFARLGTGQALTDEESPTVDWSALLAAGPVPTNVSWALFTGALSEPLDPWSFEGDLTEVRDGNGELVTRWTQLQPFSEYTLSVKPATDFAGNPLQVPDPLTISTSGAPDTTQPEILGHSPDSHEFGVPLDSTVSVDFSERVWVIFVSLRHIGSNSVPIEHYMSENGRRLTIDPLVNLLPNTSYSVTFYAYDIAGNDLRCCRNGYAYSFTTGDLPDVDTEPPTLLSINPPDGAVGVESPRATLTFSEALNRESASNAIALFVGSELRTSMSLSSDGATATLFPVGGLGPEEEITVVIGEGLEDLSGNTAEPLVSRFGYVDPDPPISEERTYVHSVRPPSGAVDVAEDASIHVFFNRPVQPDSLTNAVLASEDGVLVPGAINVSSGGQLVSFTPAASFAPGALVRLFIDLRLVLSAAGDPVGDWVYESSFTIAEPAELASFLQLRASPSNYEFVPRNTHIVVDFDRPLDPATLTGSALQFTSPSHPLTYSLENGDTRLRIVPDGSLPENRRVTLRLAGSISGLDAATLGSSYQVVFTTTQEVVTSPAELAAVSPPDESVDVPVNGSIDLLFSQRVNPLTINDSTVRWMDSDGLGVACMFSISQSNGRTTARIVPHDPFVPFEQYSLTVDGVENLVGLPASARTTTFTAGDAPDFTRPRLQSLTPRQDAPLNSVVQLRFDEPLSASTVNDAAVNLLFRDPDLGAFVPVPASVSLSPDGRTVRIDPDELLEPDAMYEIPTGSGQFMRDIAGNSVVIGITGFRTGTSVDSAPPELITVLPAVGTTDLPLNHRVTLVFDSTLRPAETSRLRLEQAGAPIAAAVLEADGIVELRPNQLLAPMTAYTWIAEDVQDLAGNVMPTRSGTFSTGTTARIGPFTPESVSPADGAVGVATNSVVVFRFEYALSPRTTSKDDFFLWNRDTSQSIPFELEVSEDYRSVSLVASGGLPFGTTIQAGIRGRSVEDMTGISGGSIETEFTTEQ